MTVQNSAEETSHVAPFASEPKDEALLLSVPKAALVVGHPGHELRVHGWLTSVRPTVLVLTDGSGTTGSPRLESSSRALNKVQARPSSIYGYFSDAGIYKAIMEQDLDAFVNLVDSMARVFMQERYDLVVSDANEGFNPTHDLCREITRAAAELVHQRTGIVLPHYEFCLTEWENGVVQAQKYGIRLQLSDEALAAKIQASRDYAELRDEVEQALATKGPEYFRAESLRRVGEWTPLEEGYRPPYEIWGEQRVRDGKYHSVLRFREHMIPIFLALQAYSSNALGLTA